MIYLVCDSCGTVSVFSRDAQEGVATNPKEDFILFPGVSSGQWFDACSVECARNIATEQGIPIVRESEKQLAELVKNGAIPEKSRNSS